MDRCSARSRRRAFLRARPPDTCCSGPGQRSRIRRARRPRWPAGAPRMSSLHAEPQIVPAWTCRRNAAPSFQASASLKNRLVVPQRRLRDRPLVAEDTLQIGLVRLGQPSRLLDERRVADSLLAVDQIRKLDHHGARCRHQSPPFPSPEFDADITQTLARPEFPMSRLRHRAPAACTSQPLRKRESHAPVAAPHGSLISIIRRTRDGYNVASPNGRLATNFGWPGPLTPWRAVRCKRQGDGEALMTMTRKGHVTGGDDAGHSAAARFAARSRARSVGCDRRRRGAQRADLCGLPGPGRQARSGARKPERASVVHCTLDQVWPGFRISPCAYLVGLLHPLVIDELAMAEYGFKWRRRRPECSCRSTTVAASSSGTTTLFARRRSAGSRPRTCRAGGHSAT